MTMREPRITALQSLAPPRASLRGRILRRFLRERSKSRAARMLEIGHDTTQLRRSANDLVEAGMVELLGRLRVMAASKQIGEFMLTRPMVRFGEQGFECDGDARVSGEHEVAVGRSVATALHSSLRPRGR